MAASTSSLLRSALTIGAFNRSVQSLLTEELIHIAYGALHSLNTAFKQQNSIHQIQSMYTQGILITTFEGTISRVSATHDEEASAKAAAIEDNTGAPTIFDSIISKEIPSTIIYEDEKVLAFRDINPQAPVHVLVIPKLRDGLTELGKAQPRHEEILGHLLHASKIVAEKEGIVDGFRVVINSGASACQSVYHLHLHVLGWRPMKWAPG